MLTACLLCLRNGDILEVDNNFKTSFGFVVRRDELEHRLDPQYYHPERRKALKILFDSKYPKAHLEDLVTLRKEKIDPQQFPNKEFVYISLANIAPHTGEIIGETRVKGEDILSSSNVFRNRDILFSRLRPYLNKVHLVQRQIENGICSTEFIVLSPKRNVNGAYLRAFLSSPFVLNQTKHMMTGYTLPRLSPADVKGIEVPLPPLKIQERLAKVVEKQYIDRRMKMKEANELLNGISKYVLEKLEIDVGPVVSENSFVVKFKDLQEGKRYDPHYYQPSVARILGILRTSKWDAITIGELAAQIVNGLDCRRYVEKGNPYIRVENVRENEIDLEEVKLVELSPAKIPFSIRLKEGDILFTRKGSYGICAVVTKELENCIISSEIIKITLKAGFNSYYVAAFMNSELGKMQTRRIAVGAIMPGISHGALEAIRVLIPADELQTEIVREIKKRIALARRLEREAERLEQVVDENIEMIILGKQQIRGR